MGTAHSSSDQNWHTYPGDLYNRMYQRERRRKRKMNLPDQNYLDMLWKQRNFDELEKRLLERETLLAEKRRERVEQDVYLLNEAIGPRYRLLNLAQRTMTYKQIKCAAIDRLPVDTRFWKEIYPKAFNAKEN